MSADCTRRFATLVLGVAWLTMLTACGRDEKGAVRSTARAAAQRARPDVGSAPDVEQPSVAPPTPGFTSSHGTVAAGTTIAFASATEAARSAPPMAASLAARASTEEQAAIQALPAGAGRNLVIGNCLICHSATMIEQQHKDSAGWNKNVTQMMAWGAPVRAADKPAILAYLAANFGARGVATPVRQDHPLRN